MGDTRQDRRDAAVVAYPPPPSAPPPTIQCQAPPPLLSLLHFVQRPGASRDFLLLDIALDDWFRTLVERIELAKLGRDDLLQV